MHFTNVGGLRDQCSSSGEQRHEGDLESFECKVRDNEKNEKNSNNLRYGAPAAARCLLMTKTRAEQACTR